MQQKELASSALKATNLIGVYAVLPPRRPAVPVLLIDDIIDSGWTFAVLAAQLRHAGWGNVYPIALASRFGRP